MSRRLKGRAALAPVLDAVQGFLGELSTGTPVIVAFSGGLDSSVLLHALRYGFRAHGGHLPTVSAAHFDHAMRAGSGADAAWSAGVCRAWGIPVVTETATVRLASEADARRARYDFLGRVRSEAGDDAVILTAHHADDQAETVLFRALRGTGPDGLRGIPGRRPGLARPLLGVWREDLEAYAADVGLCWREDPTNEHLGHARNALRHEILPAIEREVMPGARQALARLARLADVDARAWAQILPLLVATLDRMDGGPNDGDVGGRLDVSRASLLSFGRPLRSRVIRYLASDLEVVLDEAAVRRVQDLLESSTSGRSVELGGGATVSLELDRVVFSARRGDACRPVTEKPVIEGVVIEPDSEGHREAVLGDRPVSVAWSRDAAPASGGEAEASFDVEALVMPLEVRARVPGDRIRLHGGSRKVKKVLLEHRIPSATRDTLPVLVDAEGEVLWIPRVVRSTLAPPRPGAPSLKIRIEP